MVHITELYQNSKFTSKVWYTEIYLNYTIEWKGRR